MTGTAPFPPSAFPAIGFWPESALPDDQRDDLALRDMVREFCNRLVDRIREVGVERCLPGHEAIRHETKRDRRLV